MRHGVAPFVVAALASAGCDSCVDKKVAGVEDARPPIQADASPVNASPLPTASVTKMVNPDGLPAYTGAAASIEGTVTVTGELPPDVKADFSKWPGGERVYAPWFRTGPARADGAHPLADAIVVVTGYKGFFVPEREEAETVTIEDCAYTKRTVTMTFGQRLDVKNASKQLWAPYLEPTVNKVLMMAPPNGDPIKIYPQKPGHYLLLDKEHPYAVADLYAFLHPLHASTDLTGHYRIDGVPVGKVKVNTTHPRFAAEATTEIEIKAAGVIQTVDLVLKYVPEGKKTYDAGAPYPGLH